jgi:hypothetical protein
VNLVLRNNRMITDHMLSEVGIYSLTWVFQFLYHLVPGQGKPTVASAMTKFAGTGSDESTSMILTFPKGQTHGIASTSLRVMCIS